MRHDARLRAIETRRTTRPRTRPPVEAFDVGAFIQLFEAFVTEAALSDAERADWERQLSHAPGVTGTLSESGRWVAR